MSRKKRYNCPVYNLNCPWYHTSGKCAMNSNPSKECDILISYEDDWYYEEMIDRKEKKNERS